MLRRGRLHTSLLLPLASSSSLSTKRHVSGWFGGSKTDGADKAEEEENEADGDKTKDGEEQEEEGFGILSMGSVHTYRRHDPSDLGDYTNRDHYSPDSIASPQAEHNYGLLATYHSRGTHEYAHGIDNTRGLRSGALERLVGATKPIMGKATVDGTEFSVQRSTVFDEWNHQCVEPVGWHLSKLGCTFSKMAKETEDGTDAVQMQVIKGMNVFDIDCVLTEQTARVFRGIHETFTAFELDRSGFVFTARGGVMKVPKWGYHTRDRKIQYLNTSPLKKRYEPVIARNVNSSRPGDLFRSGVNYETMSETELRTLNLFRLPKGQDPTATRVTGLSRKWLEQTLINVTMFAKLEVLDVFFLEGLSILFDPDYNFSEAEVEERLTDMFGFCEELVKKGCIQYYGISSDCLAPDDPLKAYSPMPKDAMVPPRFKEPYKPRSVINLYRCLAVAEKVAGGKDQHHLRFLQYPFNLTEHMAISTPLPYDSNHTLKSLAKSLGLTCMTYAPLEARDNVGLPQRYHRHVLVPDLHTARLHFIDYINKALSKELEIRPLIDQKPDLVPVCQHLLLGSLYVNLQRQWMTNFYWFSQWLDDHALPNMRDNLIQFRRLVDSDTKEWVSQYEMLCYDFLRYRKALFQHRHALKSIEQDRLIDTVCPKLKACPIFSQKCLNFATHGGDVTTSSFYQIRYFHEATDMNPTKGKDLTDEDLENLYNEAGLSFSNYNRMHPYMLEPPVSMEQGKFSGQKSPSAHLMEPVDWAKGEWPDIPKTLGEKPGGNHETQLLQREGLVAAANKSALPPNVYGTASSTIGSGLRVAPPVPDDVKPNHLTVVDPETGKLKMAGQSELAMRAQKDPSLTERPGPLKDSPPTAAEKAEGRSTTKYIAPTLPLGVFPSKKQVQDPNFSEYLTQEINIRKQANTPGGN